MDPNQTQSDINSARQTGTDLQNQYNQQAAQTSGQYQDTYNQSQAAQKSLQDYTKQIAGMNYGNVYGQDLSNAQSMYGFDPKSLAVANKNLLNTQTAMQYAPEAATQMGNYYGTTAGGAENVYQSMAGNLNKTLANQSNAVGQYQNLLSATQNQANQQTTQQLAGQSQALNAYEATAQNATNVMDSARQTMAAIEKLQQDQGTITSGQISDYRNAYSNYVTAQASATTAAAQANLYNKQAVLAQQGIDAGNLANKSKPNINYNSSTGQVTVADGAGNPLSAGAYAKTYNTLPRDTLAAYSQNGDVYARAALQFVGNDGLPDPSKINGLSKITFNGQTQNVPNVSIYNQLFGDSYGYNPNAKKAQASGVPVANQNISIKGLFR